MGPVKAQFAGLDQIVNSASALDVKRVEPLITDLKIPLLKFQSLKPNSPDIPMESHMRFRNLLEYDALISILARNLMSSIAR
jgi:hypothetical protein